MTRRSLGEFRECGTGRNMHRDEHLWDSPGAGDGAHELNLSYFPSKRVTEVFPLNIAPSRGTPTWQHGPGGCVEVTEVTSRQENCGRMQ